ncbi:major allergen I polypeptide chain 1-like [Neovison vison]|uniref:major allergen I polypeptide chain 1-like n=1 Tax=Neovison vison TaxID=452646 RepID=UPI001CF02110|nr:major allergen I polypeptide chain 1-like [Neogale vison]
MKPAGAFLLLCAALLLISGGDCKICSSVKHDVTLFIKGTPDEYVQQVAQYRNETIILENARSLKECVDAKFTEDDQTNAINVLNKIYSSSLC